ncbi:MAG: DUF3793 family protein [Treponema sp.]
MDYLHFYCAPCLLKKKPASLFSMPIAIYSKSQKEIELLKKYGFSLKLLYVLNKNVHLLIFYEDLAKELLQIENVRSAYVLFGYEEGFTFESLKAKLFKKFQQFKSKRLLQDVVSFPHEIGLFLGYPVEDVLQYYLKKGQDYLFSGYWKVYTNPEKAMETFKLYDECRNCCINDRYLLAA